MSRGSYNFRPPENRWSGVRNPPPSHEQHIWNRMPPIPRRSSSTRGSLVQNGREGRSQDPGLTPYEESLMLRQDVPFSGVPTSPPHHHLVHPRHVQIFVSGPAGLPLLPYSLPRLLTHLQEQAGPSADESKLSRDEQKEVMTKLRREIYNPPVQKWANKPNYYIRDWAIISSRKEKEKNEDGKRCAVCLEDFEPREQVMLTPCSHMFHEDCIVPWVKNQGRCPVCRFAICERLGDFAAPRQGNGNGETGRGEFREDVFDWAALMEHAFD